MAFYSITVPSVATGAVANTFTGLVGLKFANTAGHRGRLRKVTIAGGGGAPQDYQVAVDFSIGDNTGDGTSTAVNTNTIKQHDALSAASNVSAIGKTYTAEATTMSSSKGGLGGLNTRGVLNVEWPDPETAPIWGKNEQLVIRGAPGEAAAANLTVSVTWEEGF